MIGTCTAWTRNSGTILGPDGKSYPCHFSAIQSQDTSLDVGEAVIFEVGRELVTKRPIAVMVRRGASG
jgi:cold shock CspA family protein